MPQTHGSWDETNNLFRPLHGNDTVEQRPAAESQLSDQSQDTQPQQMVREKPALHQHEAARRQTEQRVQQPAAQQQTEAQQTYQQAALQQQEATVQQAQQQSADVQQQQQAAPQQQPVAQQQATVQQAQQKTAPQQQAAPQQQQAQQQAAPQQQQAQQQAAPQQQFAAQQAQRQAAAQQRPEQPPRREQQVSNGYYQPNGQYPASAFVVQPGSNVVYAPVQEPKKNRSWIVGVVMVVCFFFFLAFCVKTCTDSVTAASYGGVSASPAGDSVAVIELTGTIQYDDSACSPAGFKTLLDRAANDDRVKAVVLRVNSGGGTATAGEEMATYLKQFDKPVVVSSASINASAAYEISSQARYIYVAKSTEIGAIGTAMQLQDLSGLMDMLGIDIEVITSADSKDSSYGFRPLTEEERAYYQHMIDQINEVFIENVAAGRNMTIDEVRTLATGLPFTGIDAVNNGLADEVGTLEDAMDKAAQLAGISSYSQYDLELTNYDLSSLYTLLGSQENGNQQAQPLLKN